MFRIKCTGMHIIGGFGITYMHYIFAEAGKSPAWNTSYEGELVI